MQQRYWIPSILIITLFLAACSLNADANSPEPTPAQVAAAAALPEATPVPTEVAQASTSFTLNAIPNQTLAVGATQSVAVSANVGTFTITRAESGSTAVLAVRIDGKNLQLTGIAQGQVSVRVTAESAGKTAVTIFNVVVTAPDLPANQPPRIDPIPPQRIDVGETLNLPLNTSDPEGFQTFISKVESGSDALLSVQSDGEGGLILQGISPGQVNVRVTVDDSQGGTTTSIFTVLIEAPQTTANQPLQVEPIDEVRLDVGDSVQVVVNATDPEGFNPFFTRIESASDSIATVVADGEGRLLVRGVSPGQVSVRVSMDDGQGSLTTFTFQVTVNPPPTGTPNLPPVFDPIPSQTIPVGRTVNIPLSARDPEGFNIFIADLFSSAGDVAGVVRGDFNSLNITAFAPGTTEISVVIDDGNGGRSYQVFAVTVPPLPTATPNIPPLFDPIPDQVVGVGQELTVFYNANDPEGFNPFVEELKSAAETIATVERGDFQTLKVAGVSPGQTTITMTITDGYGGNVTRSFRVSVTAPPSDNSGNRSPVFEPIVNQEVELGAFLPIVPAVSDPEGEALSLSVVSNNETIAPAQVTGDTITIYGAGVGEAVITITASDPQGGVAALVFLVRVPAPDLNSLPIWENPPAAIITDAVVVLGAAGADLSALQTSLAPSVAHPDWAAGDWLDPAQVTCADAVAELGCVLQSTPTLALVLLGGAEARANTPPADFAENLSAIVDVLAEAGATPILATLPGDPALVDAYNGVIVGVALQKSVPLWNLWRGVEAAEVNADLSLTPNGEAQRAAQLAELWAALTSAE